MLVDHLFLVKAQDFNEACERIRRFLKKYQLVAYESISFKENGLQPFNPLFWQTLEEGLCRNKAFVKENLKLLHDEGFEKTLDLQDIPQGYLSKQLHVIVHFLDGFFGIDSFFYNLIEDSHWLSKGLYQELKVNPNLFWLVKVRASSLAEEPLFEKIKHPS